MAMNLRLQPETEAALRSEAERTGRSQQEIVRDALAKYLKLNATPSRLEASARDWLLGEGVIAPVRRPYRKVRPHIRLSDGANSLDLLDRGDRF